MTARVGLGIGRDAVRAVLVRRGRVVWSRQTTITDDIGIRAALETTLRSLPKSFGPRRRVIAAIGPSAAQLKSISSMASSNDKLLAAAVSANSGRFFLRNGVPLRVSGVRRETASCAWVAAAEAPVTDAIEEACRSARVRYEGALPAMAVLRHAVLKQVETLRWRDDTVTGEATLEMGRLVRVVRSPNEVSANTKPMLADALEVLEGKGWELADAFAAAVTDPRDPLILRPLADAVRKRRYAIVRRGLVLTACLLMGLFALFIPGVLAARAQVTASARLGRLAALQREVSVAQHALASVTHSLQRSADFAGGRSSMTTFLSALTEKAPAMTAILNLRVDSLGGTILALSPHGAEFFAAVGQIPDVTSARITAPLTRENVESHELERVAIRFEFVRPAARAKQSGGGAR